MTMTLVVLMFVGLGCNPSKEKLGSTGSVKKCINRTCLSISEARLTGTLNYNTIRTLSNSYAIDPWKSKIYSSTNDVKNDALSVVFDLEKLKALIYFMEMQNCTNKCSKDYELGIRYYYIKYPSNLENEPEGSDLSGLDANNSNKHSLAMVPVYRKIGATTWLDYNPWASDGDNCFAQIKECEPNHKNPVIIAVPDAGENHGGIGPPPEPGTFPTQAQ